MTHFSKTIGNTYTYTYIYMCIYIYGERIVERILKDEGERC